MNQDIYSVQYIDPNEKIKPQPEPKEYTFSEIPEDDAKKLILSDKKYRYLQRHTNGEWVAKHNYKRQRELWSKGFAVNCYVSFISHCR